MRTGVFTRNAVFASLISRVMQEKAIRGQRILSTMRELGADVLHGGEFSDGDSRVDHIFPG